MRLNKYLLNGCKHWRVSVTPFRISFNSTVVITPSFLLLEKQNKNQKAQIVETELSSRLITEWERMVRKKQFVESIALSARSWLGVLPCLLLIHSPCVSVSYFSRGLVTILITPHRVIGWGIMRWQMWKHFCKVIYSVLIFCGRGIQELALNIKSSVPWIGYNLVWASL